MNYKTPGVYVEEIALFPPSVASVATAIPAFIGHTALIVDIKGEMLINKPIRLSSLLEFTELFGGPYNPIAYTIQVDPDDNFAIMGVTPVNGAGEQRRYYLFDSVRHYFDNGGGPCYVVSVGDYTDEVEYGDNTTGLRGGVHALEKMDEPTLLVAPDSVALRQGDGTPDFVQVGNLHKAIIEQCGRLQDRFGILDMAEGHRSPDGDAATNPVQQFRTEVGTENLKYAATYYPWLHTTYLKKVQFMQLHFVDNQIPPVPVPDATIDTLTGNTALDGLVVSLRTRLDEEGRVFDTVSAIALNRSNYNPLAQHFEQLRGGLIATPPAASAAVVRAAFSAIVSFVRELALALRELETDPQNSPETVALLTSLEADASLTAQLTNLIAFEKNAGVRNSIGTPANWTEDDVNAAYDALDNEDWIGGVAVASITADDSVDFTNGGVNGLRETALAAAHAIALQAAFDTIAQAFVTVAEDAMFRADQAEKILFAQHPFFKAVVDRVQHETSLLPPSGAVAGVYAATDRSRGVWKAPANVSLRGVIAPTYKLTDQEQGSLNLHSTGKSINAIRAFTGKGILVWGARTLAGNDNEWRYVNVRRFFNYVEESTKKASEPFVFESNDANTWVRIRAMIENFLTVQWRQGALAGSTPKEAFYVKVGLGETMTAQDILEGRMIVEIGMAAVRPAEFIILRFSHKMQES